MHRDLPIMHFFHKKQTAQGSLLFSETFTHNACPAACFYSDKISV
jgi:hypothetical protein